MSEKKFDIYLEFNYSKINLAAFNKIDNKLEFYKEYKYQSYVDNYKELNFENLDKILEESILEIEKSTGQFIKEVYLIVETPQSISMNLSVTKKNEWNRITTQNAMYLIQDAKQQILRSNQDIGILHIIVENYILDNLQYKLLPLDKNCNKFSVDVKFICFPKDLLKKFENLLLKHQIYINRFLCLKYLKDFDFENKEKNICQIGRNIVRGANKQEVVSITKEPEKKGFFEKLFHFFR